MNIIIIGQGAIGLLWYHKLSLSQTHNVSLLCSPNTKNVPEYLDFIDANGQQKTKIVTAKTADLLNSDLIFFCLKAYHFQQAFSDYLPYINAEVPMILCHNGILASDLLPQQHTMLTLLTTHGCKRLHPFKIEHTGNGKNDIGLTQGQLTQAKSQSITALLEQALPSTYWHENITEKQWLKLAINCVINPLTAINDCDNGVINQARFQLEIKEILDEFIDVARQHDMQFSLEELTALIRDVADKTSSNSSSMRSDILAGRKTEIAHINGFIAQCGQHLKISTPKNAALTAAITALTQQER